MGLLAADLIQDTMDRFVQNHLTQLLLHDVTRQIDQVRHVTDLNPGKGFDDADQVLFQHLIVQGIEVRVDDRITDQLTTELVQCLLEVR